MADNPRAPGVRAEKLLVILVVLVVAGPFLFIVHRLGQPLLEAFGDR